MKQSIVLALSALTGAMAMNSPQVKSLVHKIHIGEGKKQCIRQEAERIVEYAERIATQESVCYTGSKNGSKVEGEEARQLYAKLWEESFNYRWRSLELLALHKK